MARKIQADYGPWAIVYTSGRFEGKPYIQRGWRTEKEANHALKDLLMAISKTSSWRKLLRVKKVNLRNRAFREKDLPKERVDSFVFTEDLEDTEDLFDYTIGDLQ